MRLAATLSVFRPGSTSPSAILYDAWENFAHRSPKADESIRSIRPELAAAVDECIEAAGQEWEPHWQRRLLNVRPTYLKGVLLTNVNVCQAAKYGRGFLDMYNATDFLNMGRALKVLNAIRHHEIAIPMTHSQ